MNFGRVESAKLAASRTFLMTSSNGTWAATRRRGRELARSRVTKETSASGAAPGRSAAATVSLSSMLDNARCGLKRGILAESSEVESARLLEMRVRGLTRGTSRSPTFVIVVMRMTWRAALVSVTGGKRSLLRAVARLPPRSVDSTRSGLAAKWASPSRAAKTAPPMRAAPHKPVKIVPLSQRTDTRLRSKSLLTPPSRDSGGSLPRSFAPDCALCQSRALPWSNFVRPPASVQSAHEPPSYSPSFPWNLRVPIDANIHRVPCHEGIYLHRSYLR